MNDHGWKVIAGFDNSIAPADVENGIPPEQMGQYQADQTTCSHSFGYDVVHVPTQVEAKEMYREEIAFKACLTSEGFDIPELPSEATYAEQLIAGSPFDSARYVVGLVPADYERVFTKCLSPLWFPPY